MVAVGLLESSQKLLRWMVCDPGIARLINEFEDISIVSIPENNVKHREQMKSIQVAFKKNANDLVSTIQELGNPFAEKSLTLRMYTYGHMTFLFLILDI